jgi:hypothetical protein
MPFLPVYIPLATNYLETQTQQSEQVLGVASGCGALLSGMCWMQRAKPRTATSNAMSSTAS